MKTKTIFGGIIVLVVAALSVFNMGLGSKADGMSDVLPANVEALAQEITTDTGYPTGCLFNGDYYYCYQVYDNEKPPVQ